MIGEKRGMLVVVSLLLILLPMNVLAAQYVSIGWWGDEEGNPEAGGGEDSCDSDRFETLPPEYFAAVGTGPNVLQDNDCNLNAVPRFKHPPSLAGMAKGCWFFVIEDDDGADDDDGGWAIMSVESSFSNEFRSPISSDLGGNSIADSGYDQDWMTGPAECGDNDARDCLLGYSYRSDQALLCSDDELWHSCGSSVDDVGVTTWANGELYGCTDDNNVYNWVGLGFDQDQDGWATGGEGEKDCRDVPPAKDPAICSEIAFEADDLESKGKTLQELRAEVKQRCDGNIKYSQCSICINPGAAEMCGDGSDNDCEEQTSDNCHENKASCEQRLTGSCSDDQDIPCYEGSSICEDQNKGECKTVQEGEANYGICSKPPVEDPDGEPKTCLLDVEDDCGENGPCNPISQGTAKNIYDQEFSWIDTQEGGYCCGYEGVDDAGKIAKGGKLSEDDFESFVCLNKDKDIVSTEKGFASSEGGIAAGIDEIFDNSNCAGNWCWVNSAGANSWFKVFSIKKPGEQPYDVVSNLDDWLVCNSTVAEKTFKADSTGGDIEEENSNRFYCYSEGDRWSWAECTADWESRKNPSIKGRYTGEGLYTLPLSIIKDPEEPPETPPETNEDAYLRETLEGHTVTITYDNLYKKYYGKGFLDFTGYTHLNFMVRFVDESNNPAKVEGLTFPLEIRLTIAGPKAGEVIYLERSVLGDVINTPFADLNNKEATDGFMHVKVLIAEYKAVRAIIITADENIIQVRNLFLTSDKPGASNLLCSGQPAQKENSWIGDADAGDRDAGINGENLCTAVYGKKAWLGLDDEVDEFETAANCCGNAANEYYAGLSKGYLPKDASTTDLQYYGCWNSQPISSGDTIMDVEFQVESTETLFEVDYKPVSIPPISIAYRFFLPDEDTAAASETVKGTLNAGYIECSGEDTTLPVGQNFKKLCDLFFPPQFRGLTRLWFIDPLSDAEDSQVELLFYDTITGTAVGTETIYATAVDGDENLVPSPNKKDYFPKGTNLPGQSATVQFLSEAAADEVWTHPLAVAVRLRKNHYFPIEESPPSTKPVTENVTYACSEPECLFPLPGNPPYKVTNLHPDLYELYYVTSSQPNEDVLITQTNKEFYEYANLKVKRIAQQVLYYNDPEDSTKDIGFYGCRAADFITNVEEDKNLQYCAVIGDKFCSFSEVHEEENNKDAFTIINSWSEEALTHVGYADLPKPEEGQNISAYYETIELTLRESRPGEMLASSRNQSASVVPARNFIPNAEFATSATKLPYWEVFLSNGQAVADEKTGFVKYEDNKVTLASNQKLRSERISVPSSVDLHFSAAQECAAKILLVDKDGNSQSASLPQFNTGAASYLIVEFTGACEVEKPLLQLVDELGPAEYSYKSSSQLPPEFPNPDARSGAACCPNNYCWNGYACVEPMGALTTTTEHIADGRDYRCINGEWKRSVLKFDWNAQQWGFCPKENECFVLGSGKAENTAKSFYTGEYPICVNNSEYIFDNYCNLGNWTSRTKFLATKLLEVAENDEYVLYCSPYKEALLEWGNDDNKLGGTITVTEKPVTSLDKSLQPKAPTVLSTCYPNLDKRLVPDEQNTCINNVCILQYKDGGVFKAAFATTLNKDIADPNSFLLALNIPQEKLSQVCQGPGNDFIECDLQDLEFPDNADLYHSKELNAVIYAQDGIQLEPGVIDNIVKWFKNLFGSGLLAEKTFVTQAQNFRNVYIADVDGKKVRAVEEIFPDVKQTLVAEYQNFATPVCEYVKNIKVPPELQLELLEQASGIEKVHCAINGTTQKVVINAGLDFFWPQLTGKLRIGESS